MTISLIVESLTDADQNPNSLIQFDAGQNYTQQGPHGRSY